MHHGGGGGPEIFLFVSVEKSTGTKVSGLVLQGLLKEGAEEEECGVEGDAETMS